MIRAECDSAENVRIGTFDMAVGSRSPSSVTKPVSVRDRSVP